MTTEKQIAANRSNAKRSTGPKSVTGKIRSSRNALRHGLSRPIAEDSATLAKIKAVADALTAHEQHQCAETFARSQLEISRIRGVRANILARTMDSDALRTLFSLDRYERAARAKGRRARHLLTEEGE